MEIVEIKNNPIENTIKILKGGGLVIFPSDTVYGLLVDAYNEEAVRKLIAFKNRPPGKPISVFVDWDFLYDLVLVSEKQKELLKNILPGPFTVVLKSKGKVCPLLESEKKTLGIRIPDYQPVNSLVKKFKRPITATSANLSCKSPHYSIESLLKQLPESKKKLIDLIVDAGKLPRNKPSTVIDLVEENIKILRRGDIVFTQVDTYLSRSAKETKKIAKFVLNKLLEKDFEKPLVFIIEGEIGVGKTVFVKGMGEFLGIKEIVSPTFVVMYEYEVEKSKVDKLIHLDLYNVEEKEEFEYLKIGEYLAPGNLLAIEWGEKVGEIFDLLKEKGEIVYVKMSYENEKERVIEVKFV
jgi:L-threonylcarbamoyladenylate synthase